MAGPLGNAALVEPELASPLACALSSMEREVLTTVRTALSQRRMRLAYQPAVYAADPSIIGFYEGYIRLLDAQDRVIPARDFMPVVEMQELGREIDLAALQLGLQTLQEHPGIRVAVNMSARSVGYAPWTQLLWRSLLNHPGIGRGLILEISEATAVQMPDVLIPFMNELRPQGIAFTLDDYAAGATSLQLLAAFRFDIAKLDGRFVRGIDRYAGHQKILRGAIALAQEFGMFLTAESVETHAEAEWLRDQGVGCLQGFFFGAPDVSPDFAAFLAARLSADRALDRR
ncbi:EAL domain-containing protein [Xinfangfangia sp. CPCC 101601]|uniref:EAL domain-containing protein n=1 Tax=Pseudogemmobacter lacusdianii TaxID=3069608 RepID=A0ABU0VX14_9RHOB|nr:EAL domain-containing protein [Xinfangfangia sp. CPCC 101601]MDQ2066294.1 EAL domain-containing protein [Xinfangfangia sp. CPCC 101601]